MEKNEIVTYKVNNEEIKLTEQIVRNLTNNNSNITSMEIDLFVNLCKFAKLNPFMREAYLVKYKNDAPAQMVVSLNAFMRIADEQQDYDGMEDGIVVQTSDNKIIDRAGCLMYNGEKLIGGWAKVYRKNRKIPSFARLSLKEYGKTQSTWNSMPATMINKCAKVSALRKAFPSTFNNMYMEDELQDVKNDTGDSATDKIYYDLNEYTEVTDNVVVDNVVEENVVEENIQANQVTSVSQQQESNLIYMNYKDYLANKDSYEQVPYPETGTAYDSATKKIRVKRK